MMNDEKFTKIIFNGKVKIGAIKIPEKKKPAIGYEDEKGNIVICGYFNSIDCANDWMNKLCNTLNIKEENKRGM